MLTPPRNPKPFTRRSTADGDVRSAVKVEFVGSRAGDPAACAAQRKGLRTAGDQRQVRERLADGGDAVAGVIAVADDC
jgi:hypothetical protein